jgi:uncharacterized protein with HEPN domain
MKDGIKTYLYDILTAINEIDSFLADRPKTFAEYKRDIRTKRAVERNIEIIGAAMSRILKCNGSIEVGVSRRIVNTRNRIIYGYDSVSDENIWAIIINNLPVLKVGIENMLS